MKFTNTINEDISEALFNALPTAAAIIAEGGDIIATNSKWDSESKGIQWFGIEKTGDNYFDHCEKAVKNGDDHALKLIFGLRDVIDRAKNQFELTAPYNKKSNELNWFKVLITPYDQDCVLVQFEDITKSMKSMQSLRESTEIYSQHFKNSLAGIILGTPEGDIIDINPAACNILGYDKEELMKGGRTLITDDNSPINKKANTIREKKSIYEGEKEYTHKSGEIIIVEVSSVLYKNEHNQLRIINTFRDKSKEKATLRELQIERRFTESVINSIPNVFFVIDKDLELVRWNNTFEEMFNPEDLISGKQVLEYIVEGDRARLNSIVSDVFTSGTGHAVVEVMTKKGNRHFHVLLSKFANTGDDFLVGTATDITDIIEIEKERDKNYELISQLFESSPLGMIMMNKDHKITKVNDSFTTLFGYNKLELIGENLINMVVPEEEMECFNSFCKEVFEGRGGNREVVRETKSGEKRNIIINAIPIWQDDEVVAAYSIYVDLTEQKRLEARLQDSLDEKEVLLQEVHHRVKNNLAVIAGLLDLQIMEEDTPLIEGKLNEVRSRIFTIAKIHETIYQKEEVVHLRFDDYLNSVMIALPQVQGGDADISVKTDFDEVTLNLNQAVPCGLAINEIMNIIFTDNDNLMDLAVSLKYESDLVQLVFESENFDLDSIDPVDSELGFRNKLIEIFLSQINGSLSTSKEGINKVILTFKKADTRGSSSSVLNTKELGRSNH